METAMQGVLLVRMSSVLPSRVLVQPRAQGSAALNAAQACIPPGKWPCSEFWGTMLQRRSPGLTLLPQLFSDLLYALGTAGKNTESIISNLEVAAAQAHGCTSVLLAILMAGESQDGLGLNEP